MRGRVGTSPYAGLLFTVLGAIAWACGQPFIFPSLGPTAFVLAYDRRSERTHARRVVGSHLIGGGAGLAAWWALAGGTPPRDTGGVFRRRHPARGERDGLHRADELGVDRHGDYPPAGVCDDTHRLARPALDADPRWHHRRECRAPGGVPRAVLRLFDRRWATTPQDYLGPD
jgi:hypothetical protein